MNKYIGHENQLRGVEEMRIVGGKGDGMRILNVRNGKGLEFTVLADRAADIARLSLKGDNFGYFAPCGYVSPKFYDNKGAGFLKSFTGGFMTTCGLTAVGSPCVDDGEELPLHGTIANTPCENIAHWTENDEIHIKAIVRDAAIFDYQLILEREYVCSLTENKLILTDKIKNIGSKTAPIEVLYHCNMGYPLLSENAVLNIPSNKVTARDAHAQTGIDCCAVMEKPQAGYEEMCYYHEFEGQAQVSIFNHDIQKGLRMSFDTAELKCFAEWKMMGEYDYVLGLEPGNCYPDGRDVMRQKGMLEFLKSGETKTHHITFEFVEE